MISSKGICSTKTYATTMQHGLLLLQRVHGQWRCTVTFTEKGCRNVNSISQTLNQCTIQVKTGLCVHKKCRLDFIRFKKTGSRNIDQNDNQSPSMRIPQRLHVPPWRLVLTPQRLLVKLGSQLVKLAVVSCKTTFLHRYNLITSKRNPEVIKGSSSQKPKC